MSEKWTKGPWGVLDDHPKKACLHIMPSSSEFFNTVASVYMVNPERDTHNAHLIAAAPELYEALEEALRDWDDSHFDEEYPYKIEWADKARAALAKARGDE